MLCQTPTLVPHLSSFNRDFAKHKRTIGDNIPFPESIDDVYEFLLESKCPTELSGPPSQSTAITIIPTANYASKRRVVCELCDGNHDEDDCHKRGLPFMPPSMAKKVMRYNEVHGSVPKVPKKDVIQTPYKPRHKNVTPTAKMASVSVPVDNSPPIPDLPKTDDISIPLVDTTTEPAEPPPPAALNDNNHIVTPAVSLAEFKNLDSEYIEYIFPSASTASIDLARMIPADYISYLTPSACMAGKSLPVLSSDTSNAEEDELFTHNVLQDHVTTPHIFHADWGANIIIVNKKELFTELVPCEECLSPINGIPITGIKGFGTVIFHIGQRLVPVREVAYMPANPHCTFTTSHLQRLNGYLSGIHAMHSSVKLINCDGISTKFVPVVKNGLDYISVSVITPTLQQNSKSIVPTACQARSLSPQLIHQKCGHFFHARIVDLAKRKLVEGIPTNIPKLETPCPICLATKSVHHPRRPPADYTLLKPGQQLHMDW